MATLNPRTPIYLGYSEVINGLLILRVDRIGAKFLFMWYENRERKNHQDFHPGIMADIVLSG